MAAFVLFLLAVAGAVVVADLVWENTTVGQIAVFHYTVTGYPQGWLLAIAAGFGFVVALLLVASVNSTKRRRARRKQLARLRHGREDQMAAPEPDHARLLDAFFGPEESSRHLGGPARPAELRGRRPSSPADDHQRLVTPPQPIQHPAEPRFQQVRSTHVREEGWEGRAEDPQGSVTAERVEYPPEPLYEQARRAAGRAQDWDLPVAASQGAGGSVRVEALGAQGAATTCWSHGVATADSARLKVADEEGTYHANPQYRDGPWLAGPGHGRPRQQQDRRGRRHLPGP